MHLVKRHHKNLSRDNLILLAQQDDYHALEELIKREQKNVYASFYYLDPNRQDIPDLTQEALFRMAKNIKKLRDPKKFQSWFNQIITNLFHDEMRKKYKKLNNKIISAIHTLPEPFRVAIVLRELQGLSYEEISNITQTSIGTIKSRIARARTKLQENLKPYLIQ